MKWILSLLICWSASAQLPVIPFSPNTAAPFIPNSIANQMLYWFELTPINGAYLNTDGSGGHPGDGVRAGSWTNLALVNNLFSGNSSHFVTNYTSGGGNNFTSPRLLFNAGIGTGYPSTSQVNGFTNFTAIIVANCSNAVTASQEIYGNANFAPFLDFNASKLTISQGTVVSGAATIASSTFYIITWKANGASSEIDTNGVLYVSGNAGILGFAPGAAGPEIAHDRVNQFVGNISRIWCWTNQLSAGDMTKAINQCKSDFGFP